MNVGRLREAWHATRAGVPPPLMSDTGGSGDRLSRLAAGHRHQAARKRPLLPGTVAAPSPPKEGWGLGYTEARRASAVQAVWLLVFGCWLLGCFGEGLVCEHRAGRREAAEAGRSRRPGVGGPTSCDAARSA